MKGYKESSEQLTYEEATTACSERTYFFASPLQALKNYGFINSNGELKNELKNFSEIETSNSDRDRTCDYRSYTDNVKTEKRLSFDEFIEKCVDWAEECYAEEKTEKDSINTENEPTSLDQIAVSDNKVRILFSDPSGYFPQVVNSQKMARIASSCYSQIINSGWGARIAATSAGTKIINSGLGTRIAGVNDGIKIGNSGIASRIFTDGMRTEIVNIGDATQIVSTGRRTRITSSGENAVICCTNQYSCVKAKKGSWVTLTEWEYDKEKKRDVPVCVKTEYVDGVRIKENVYYELKDGEFKEVLK